jgi:serine/threonine-protein kinase RsbW
MSDRAPSDEDLAGRHVFDNRREEVQRVQRLVLAALSKHDYDEASCFAIRLALEEALTNAYKHGNKEDPRKKVTLEYRIEPNRVELGIADEGDGFDPDAVPDPTAQENLEIPAGRGLMLIRSFMTIVQIDPPGNRLHMVYERQSG